MCHCLFLSIDCTCRQHASHISSKLFRILAVQMLAAYSVLTTPHNQLYRMTNFRMRLLHLMEVIMLTVCVQHGQAAEL